MVVTVFCVSLWWRRDGWKEIRQRGGQCGGFKVAARSEPPRGKSDSQSVQEQAANGRRARAPSISASVSPRTDIPHQSLVCAVCLLRLLHNIPILGHAPLPSSA
jgi:hypothetical protein